MNNDDLEQAAMWLIGWLMMFIGVAILGLTLGITCNILQYFGVI